MHLLDLEMLLDVYWPTLGRCTCFFLTIFIFSALYVNVFIKILIFRFGPGDTNLVLREFEKCGVILKHIPGPRDANWMHILYQVCSV